MPAKKPSSSSQRYFQEKIAQGLCGYCGAEPIAFPRSRIRGEKCLERADKSRRKYERSRLARSFGVK